MLRKELVNMGISAEFFGALTDEQLQDLVTGLKKIAEIYVRLDGQQSLSHKL